MWRFIAVLVMLGAYPSSLLAETMEQALAYAYNNNPSLLAQRAYLRSVDENVAQAKSGWRPKVSLVADVTPSKTKTSGTSNDPAIQQMYGDSDSSKVGYGAGLNLSQPIFSGFKTVSQTKASENTVKAQRAVLRQVEQQVLIEAATAYVDVLTANSILELKVNNEKLLKRELDRTMERFKVGEVTRTDVSQAEARYAGAIAGKIDAEGALQIAKANYLKAVGKMPEDLQEPIVSQEYIPSSLEEAVELARKYNPAVISAEYVARSAWYNINTATGDLLPEINLTATARKDWNTPLKDFDTETYQASANLTIPLYEGGAVYSKVRQAKQIANQQRILKEKVKTDALNSATQAWESLTSSKASIQSIETQITASARALEGVKKEALAGERTVLDVLNAEQELLNNKVSLISAKRDEIVSSYNLMSALGRMTAQNLALNVEIYDSLANYNEVEGKWFGTDIGIGIEK